MMLVSFLRFCLFVDLKQYSYIIFIGFGFKKPSRGA